MLIDVLVLVRSPTCSAILQRRAICKKRVKAKKRGEGRSQPGKRSKVYIRREAASAYLVVKGYGCL